MKNTKQELNKFLDYLFRLNHSPENKKVKTQEWKVQLNDQVIEIPLNTKSFNAFYDAIEAIAADLD